LKSLSQLLIGLGMAVVLFGLALGSLLLSFVEQGKTRDAMRVNSTEPGIFLPQMDTATAQTPTITQALIISETAVWTQAPSQSANASITLILPSTSSTPTAMMRPTTPSAAIPLEQGQSGQTAGTGTPASQTRMPSMTLIPVTVISNPKSLSTGWESATPAPHKP
jgi:hypothetical protein